MYNRNRLDSEAFRKAADRDTQRAMVDSIAAKVSPLTVRASAARPAPAQSREINGQLYSLCPVTKRWVLS